LARIGEFSGTGSLLDLPARRVDRQIFQDLGLSFQCCLDYDILIADELARPRQEKVAESWMTYLQGAPDAGKTVILTCRETNKLVPHCTHLLLIDQADLLAYGPSASLKTEFADFLDRAAEAGVGVAARADMLRREVDDEDEFV
jgi:ABC-type polysaccharide/polyol phosphate transport system ATPase subunit